MLLAVLRRAADLLRARLQHLNALQTEQADHVLAERGFFADRFDQRELHAGVEDLEREARKAGAGADIDEPTGRSRAPGQDAGERVEEVLGADRLGIADGGEVELLIPFEQLALIDAEHADLTRVQRDAEELLGA